jgi:hypothetical protein
MFVFPGERSMLGEIREVPRTVVELSSPTYALAEFTGPFATPEEAQSHLGDRPASPLRNRSG